MATQPEVIKSSPDRAKLSAMTNRTVQVTRQLVPNKPGQTIIPAQKNASMDWIDELPGVLLQSWGPGTYKIEVFEEGGPEKDFWTAKIGPEQREDAMNGNGANGGATGLPGGVALGGLSGDGAPTPARHLGHGFWYDEGLGLLTTPAKQVIPWRPGEPFPGGLGPVGAAPATPFGAPATPWGAPASPWPGAPGAAWGGGGWGGYPTMPTEDSNTKRELESMRAELKAANDRAAEAERRREAEAAQMRFEKALAESKAQTDAVLAELRASREQKPAGPDPALLAVQAQLEQQRQQMEQQQRQHVEELRRREEADARTRSEAEARQREDRIRDEIKNQNVRFEGMIRELSGNKTDPFLTVLTQMMTQQQSAATESVRAISESTRAQLESARMQSLTPEKMITMMETLTRTSQGANGEINKNFIGMFNQLFDMQTNMMRLQMEGRQGEAVPAWVPMAQQGMEQVGQIAKIWAMGKAREAAAAAAAAAGGVRAPQQQVQQQRPVQQVQQAPQQQQLPAQPARQPDSIDVREAAAAAVFGERGADGRPIGRPTPAAAAPAPAPAAASTAAPAAPAAESAPATKPKKGRRGEAAAPPAPAAPAAPEGEPVTDADAVNAVVNAVAAADGTEPGAPTVPISQMPQADVHELVGQMDDNEVFTPALLQQVQVLRESVAAGGLPPEEVANAVLMSRQYFQSFNIFPPCLELLAGGYIDLLVDRMLPMAAADFRKKCADAIRVQLRAEQSGAVAEGGDQQGQA